jgi:hypothetical protein
MILLLNFLKEKDLLLLRNFAVIDAETTPFKKGRLEIVPFIWGFYDGQQYLEFTNTTKLIDFLRQKKIIIYAHNGGKFDYHFLKDYFNEFENIMIIDGRISKFKIGKCEFRDSFQILPIPLRNYKKDDMDYNIMEENERIKPENMAKIKAYLKNDCIYLYELIEQFKYNYGNKLTIASSALLKWQEIMNTIPPKTTKDFYDKIKPYYYGGHVEVFKNGIIKKPFKIIDINSAYPYAMIHNHPYGDKYEIIITDKIKSQDFISLTCYSKGAFPIKDKNGTKYPIGKFEFHITGWEYLSALKCNLIFDVYIHKVIRFKEEITFKEYVNHFYTMKKEAKEKGDKANEIFAKLFLNSLYGKFGANPEKYKEYMLVPKNFIEQATEIDGYVYGGDFTSTLALMEKPLSEEHHIYYNIAVAASITGFVRAFLMESIYKCKHVLYCDTDSIVAQDISDLKLSNELGDWKLEATCTEGAIAGKKLYAFKMNKPDKNGKWYKIASKGVKLTHKEIYKIAKGATVEFTSDAPCFSIKKESHFITRKIKKT